MTSDKAGSAGNKNVRLLYSACSPLFPAVCGELIRVPSPVLTGGPIWLAELHARP